MKRTFLPMLLAVILLVPFMVQSMEKSEKEALEGKIAELTQRVADLEAKLRFVSVSTESISGLAGPHMIFDGVNIHVRSGSGSTSDNIARGEPLSGLGNLVVGYNEIIPAAPMPRTGSHNLVVGPWHSFSSYGGLIAGSNNKTSAPFASVTGGTYNVASGTQASVGGGSGNEASGNRSSISGGGNNMARGLYASISGGSQNEATSLNSSVSGGWGNVASGMFSCVSGGSNNFARGDFSTCSGGRDEGAY
ncbi:MAG: hypothetical protein GTN70_06515 [Deltaproteobacteria bacterium]|nr:hypothetical protein [Deltaproteobacteria bacterium]NIS77338.1 hypothetical protein [Deltaproteobacteria bacterium]